METAEANGIRFYLRPNTSDRIVFEDNILRHSYEKHGVEVRAGDAWLDIGGYIGTFTANLIYNGCSVVTFEPDPDNAEMIRKNLALNGMRSTLIEKAVTAFDAGELPLYKNNYRGNFAANTLFPHWKKERPSVIVPCIAFDHAFHLAKNILGAKDINVKLDCEGAEIGILENLSPDLPIRQICLEYHFSVDKNCERYWAIAHRLMAFGFEVHTTDKVPETGVWPNPRHQTIQVFCVRK